MMKAPVSLCLIKYLKKNSSKNIKIIPILYKKPNYIAHPNICIGQNIGTYVAAAFLRIMARQQTIACPLDSILPCSAIPFERLL